MTTVVRDCKLTREDLRAMKLADSVTFHHAGGRSFINLTRGDLQHCTDTRIYPNAYFDDHCPDKITDIANNSECYGKAYSDRWAGFLGAVKVGDWITLHWRRGAAECPSLREHGVTGDQLEIVIRRPSGKGNGTTRMAFLMDEWCGPPDSLARMIRFA